jgi:hypothetical protein
LNDWAEEKHPRLPESNDGESVIEDRITVPPSALFTMPPIGYVAAVWASLNRPCPHVLFTLIAHVLKAPKMKNLAAALPIELQVDVARDAVEQDADAMDSNRTLLKQGATPPLSFVTSMPPLKNNPVASVVPVPGLESVLGTEIL